MTNPIGLESDVVRLVEHDERWPSIFAAEAARIRDGCGARALSLEHVGSTAVPALCAKPILDIVAGHPASTGPADYVVCLREIGYTHRGEQGVPGREFLYRGQPRAFHVHLVEAGGVLWRRYVAFRDYLRSDPVLVGRYADLKRSLATRFPRDREAYTAGKAVFVNQILRRAGVV